MLRLFGEREYVANAALRGHAVVIERGRVARDVHDVLGHSLTALSVKAELAARLIDLDPARLAFVQARRAELTSLTRRA